YFDTLTLITGSATQGLIEAAQAKGINLRQLDNTHIGISLDQVTGPSDVQDLLSIFAQGGEAPEYSDLRQGIEAFAFPGALEREKIGRASCSDSVSIACVAGLLR